MEEGAGMSLIIRVVIQQDYDRGESAGAEGMFQVSSVYGYDSDDNETDLTNQIDQGTFYKSGRSVVKDLGLNPDIVYIEEE